MTAFPEDLAEILAALGPVRRVRFFGGEGFSAKGRQFAMVMKGTLYLRCDTAMATELEASGAAPFRYRTRRGEVEVRAYWTAPPEAVEDPEVLLAWARRALA